MDIIYACSLGAVVRTVLYAGSISGAGVEAEAAQLDPLRRSCNQQGNYREMERSTLGAWFDLTGKRWTCPIRLLAVKALALLVCILLPARSLGKRGLHMYCGLHM